VTALPLIEAVPVADPPHGSVNVRVKLSVDPVTVPAKLPSDATAPVTEQPDCARTIMPLPDRPHESLQNMFRVPATLAH
jgi:hypothetical protein